MFLIKRMSLLSEDVRRVLSEKVTITCMAEAERAVSRDYELPTQKGKPEWGLNLSLRTTVIGGVSL